MILNLIHNHCDNYDINVSKNVLYSVGLYLVIHSNVSKCGGFRIESYPVKFICLEVFKY
jgi:hypothetical protein